MKKIILFLIILSSTIIAQKLELGFRAEWNGLKLNIANEEDDFVYNDHLPSSFQGLVGFYLTDNIVLQPRIGAEVYIANFAGMEYSLFLNYKFKKQIYAIAGIIRHSTIADWNSGSRDDTIGTHQKRYNIPAFGFGFIPYKGWTIELMYLEAGNVEISYMANVNDEGKYLGKKPHGYLNWAVKLSVGYTWIFPFD